ncbi:hypothetical protein EMIT093MI4_160051 [Pseudomonas sp. IT-93MI4]
MFCSIGFNVCFLSVDTRAILFNTGGYALVSLSLFLPNLRQVRYESDCVDGGVRAGGVHNPGPGEHRRAEFRCAVRLSGQSAARGGSDAGVCVVAGTDGPGPA